MIWKASVSLQNRRGDGPLGCDGFGKLAWGGVLCVLFSQKTTWAWATLACSVWEIGVGRCFVCLFFAKNDVGMGHFRVTLPENPAGELLFFFFWCKKRSWHGPLECPGVLLGRGFGSVWGVWGRRFGLFAVSHFLQGEKIMVWGAKLSIVARFSPHIQKTPEVSSFGRLRTAE